MIGPQWLESIKEVSGLDPLGVQAISISIYGYLLPGMTNVTNRLRYYTFLCWVLSNYAKKSGSAKIEDWHYYLRKSEFLFALIAEMHHCEENYSSSMVGSRTTSPLIKKEKKEVIDIAKYTKLEGPHKSYFQNPGGGFAQYYQGPMKSLKFIVDGGEIRWQLADDIAEPKEKQFGVKAAKIFDSNAHLDLFHRCVIAEQVSREQLKKMADSLCACRIETNKDEQALLLNILFDLNDQYAESGLRRRKSLRLLLNLIINDENTGLSVEEFRNICMYHYYSNGKRLKIREDETEVINFWDVYQTHEYFAFALQCLLYVFERMVKKTNGSFNEVFEEMRKEALQVDPDKVQSMAAFKRVDIGMNALLSKFITSISFSNSYDKSWFSNAMSEYFLMKKFDEAGKKDDLGLMTCIAIFIIGKVYFRAYKCRDYYKGLKFNFSEEYQMTIDRLKKTISNVTEKDDHLWSFVYIVIKEFVVDWHANVALRKFRYNKKSTLRFGIQNNKFVLAQRIKLDWPVFTHPRLAVAFRFLEDAGLLREIGNARYVLTKQGHSFLEKVNGL